MSQEMMDKTCRGFAEALAAREPVPGGGSASAFVGALGASLCGMVARYGATNPALADRAGDLTRAFAQADELAQELVCDFRNFKPYLSISKKIIAWRICL